MVTLDYLRPLDAKLLRDWWAMRAQALAIAFVLAAGVGMVVMSMGMIRSLDQTRASFYADYRLADIFAPAVRAPATVVERIARIPGVAKAEGRVSRGVLVDLPAVREPASARLLSLPTEGGLNGLVLRSGRLPEAGRPDEVVASELFAAANRLRPGDRLGTIIYGKRLDVTIVGTAIAPEFVYALGPGLIFPDNRRFGILWMGERPLAAALNMTGAVNEVLIRLDPGADEQLVLRRVDALLSPYGGVGAFPRRDLLSDRFLSNELKQLTTMTGILPPIFLGVAAFLINMVLSRTVDSEREEIGLLMAFGYRGGAIATHYGKLALMLTLPGLLLGLGLGAWLGHGLASIYQDFFVFPYLDFRTGTDVFLSASGVALLVGLGGAIGSVRRIRRLTPTEAMRPPLPASYSGWFARAVGEARWLDEPSKIVLRGIVRQPLRSLASMLGLAGAVGLYIMSASSTDNSSRLISILFDQSNRADLTILFAEPRDARALHELTRIPGVIRVEPVLALPARLGTGAAARNDSLTAISRDADLYRLVDIDGLRVEAPPRGLALGQGMADRLAANVGSRLPIRATEGRRREVSLEVQRLVKSPVGDPALVSGETMDRIRLTGPVASGAYLAIDPLRLDALFKRLKSMPNIAGVTLRSAALRGIDETISDTMGIVTLFNTAFAMLIIAGVVVNNARIALAERARDLASLRVLGFRRTEVSYILLGELTLLSLLSVPVGLLFGHEMTRWMVSKMGGELFILPFGLTAATMATAVLIMAAGSAVSAILVSRRLDRLDLVAVLKTWE